MSDESAAVNAEFHGGPADGRLEAVQRKQDGVPARVTLTGHEPQTGTVLRHYYKLHADVGPAARYEFVRTERLPMGTGCKHCNQPITPCDGREYSCLGWIHVVGSHICQTDGMLARAEPERAQP